MTFSTTLVDREAFTETHCELRARIDRIISEDRQDRDVSLAESQTLRAPHKIATFQCLRLNCPLLKFQN